MPADLPFRLRALDAAPRLPARPLRLVTLAAFGALLAGCAAPGEPTPRRPPVPEAVKDLSVHQQGDGVVLDFTLPRTSTQDAPLVAPPTIEIYRGSLPAPGAAAAGTPAAGAPATPADCGSATVCQPGTRSSGQVTGAIR